MEVGMTKEEFKKMVNEVRAKHPTETPFRDFFDWLQRELTTRAIQIKRDLHEGKADGQS
jgi:hypothetical protein